MSYKINRRRLKKIYNRIANLPGGLNFFKYSANKLNGLFLTLIKSTKVPFPSSILLEVTNHCNLACITCPREYDFGLDMDKGMIKSMQLKKVVDEVAPYIDAIGLTGLGETLLYKNLEETLKYIKSKNKGIQTFISTNGHVPNAAKYIERMAQYLDTVQISIDGIGEVYEKVRLKSDFNFFLQTTREIISVCKENNVALMFNFVIIKENYRQMKNVVELAISLGVESVNFTPVNLSSITSWSSGYYEMFYGDDFKNELKSAFEIAKKSPLTNLSIWDIKKKNEFKKCHLPWNHFYVSWNGQMPPCCAKPFPKELNFGDIFNSSLMDCLNSKEYRSFRKMWFENKTPDFCKKCHIVDLKPVEIDFDIALN